MRLVLDSGAVSRFSRRDDRTAARLSLLKQEGPWPPVVPSVVLVECLSGRQRDDVITQRFLSEACDIDEALPWRLARRAGELRTLSGRASTITAVDAAVVAMAEPNGIALSTDLDDLRALAAHAPGVVVEPV